MRARFSLIAALSASLVLVATADALAEKRVALVIGVSIYQHVPHLPNATNDAASMTALFKNAGFDAVAMQHDIGIVELRRAVRDFADVARDADIAVFYFAGHGIEVGGTNYLIPADAKLMTDFDVEDETISLDRVLSALGSAKRLRLVILDACRENPFAKSIRRSVGTRSVGQGLAKIEPTMTDTLIAFAAKAGALAADGDGPNSPFTAALVKYITSPGVDLRIAFGHVRDEVFKSTGRRQEPFVYGSLGGETVALVPQAAAPVDPNAEARRDYEFAAQIGTKQAWESFLEVHTSGLYANLARAQYGKLQAAEQASVKAEEATRQAEEQARLKSEELGRQADEQVVRQTDKVRRQVSDQTKRELEEIRRQLSEKAQRDLEEARRLVEEAKRQADEARRQVDDAKRQAVNDARAQVEEAKRQDEERAKKVAAIAPMQTATQPAPIPVAPVMDPTDITRLLQAHLKRVGCDPGTTGGDWGDSSKKALNQFNKITGMTFDVKLASLDALDAVRAKTSRVCPLVCGKGQRTDGDRCVQITCNSGFALGADGTCHKRQAPPAKPVARDKSRAPAAGTASAIVSVRPSPRGVGPDGSRCFMFNGKRFCE